MTGSAQDWNTIVPALWIAGGAMVLISFVALLIGLYAEGRSFRSWLGALMLQAWFRNIVLSAATIFLLSLLYKGLHWVFDNAGFAVGMFTCAAGTLAFYLIALAVDRHSARH